MSVHKARLLKTWLKDLGVEELRILYRTWISYQNVFASCCSCWEISVGTNRPTLQFLELLLSSRKYMCYTGCNIFCLKASVKVNYVNWSKMTHWPLTPKKLNTLLETGLLTVWTTLTTFLILYWSSLRDFIFLLILVSHSPISESKTVDIYWLCMFVQLRITSHRSRFQDSTWKLKRITVIILKVSVFHWTAFWVFKTFKFFMETQTQHPRRLHQSLTWTVCIH